MKKITLALIFLLIIYQNPSYAFELPQNLNEFDRSQVTQILGHTTSSRVLTHPYPLGGYSGFEFAISYIQIPTSDISHLGDQTESQPQFSFQKINVSKGLYENVDVTLNFAPPIGSINISAYGGLIKWVFYQEEFVPINMALVTHANTATIEDSFTSTTLGAEALIGLSLNQTSIYFGFGALKTRSKFLGQFSSNLLTDSGNDESSLEVQSHSYLGLAHSIDNWILAFQADRYNFTTFSFKLGFRY